MTKKQDIIIYGAGNMGKKIGYFINDWYNILFFVDSDKNKWGSEIFGKKVCSPEVLTDYRSCAILIASSYYLEIYNKLLEIGMNKIFLYEFTMPLYSGTFIEELNNYRTIDLGKFLYSLGKIDLEKVTYIWGGSGVLDYAFLRGIISKFKLENYLEIGTYIGESINNIADLCKVCHSITLPKNHENSMKKACKRYNLPDYSERLTDKANIIHHYCDSKDFDFTTIKENIDIYFIDGDHSYEGCKKDTENIFNFRNEDSFVIWHDIKIFRNVSANANVLLAIKDVLKDEFKNVFVTDNNICGIYIPTKYQKYFPLKKYGYTEEPQDLYYYETTIKSQVNSIK